MKLFTSLTATAAFAQAQDFPGFGGSLADLLAQLNIENQLDLGIGAQAGNDAIVNATDGEFDPITGERYLIATEQKDEDDPFTNDCDPNTANTAAEHCNPCVFDPSVCNGSPVSCTATQDGSANGIPLGINDNGTPGDTSDDWWNYTCDCTTHTNLEYRTDSASDTWAGPDCQCSRCTPHNLSTGLNSGELAACDATDPCTAEHDDLDSIGNSIDITAAEVCSEVAGTNDYTCACDPNKYGQHCDYDNPCANDFCNSATGTQEDGPDELPNTADDICVCDCATHPTNTQIGFPPNILGGLQCDQTICEREPVTCVNGSLEDDITTDPTDANCKCSCQTNWSGADCTVDFCASTTCQNNGEVDRSIEGQCSCICPAGFTGAQCETATNAPTGEGCWKCDAMTYVQCATEGSFQKCSEDNTNGDNGVCFVEYREQNQKLTQLCTGCKDAKSCDNLKRQNFVPGFVAGNTSPYMRMRNQCKPDYRLQVARRRYGNTQSVCRQCFSMCSNANAASAQTCFGGLGDSNVFTAGASDAVKIGAAQWIRYYENIVGGAARSSSPWNNGVGGSTDKLLRNGNIANNEAIVLGIPLHMNAVHADSQTFVDSMSNHVFRGYSKADLETMISNNGGNPLVSPVSSDTDKPLYWTLADSTDYFWSNDLIYDQSVYNAHNEAGGSAFVANGYDVTRPCELDYGADNYCDRS